VGTIFALPWLITWFGHVLPDYEDVVRLYDFFLASPPLMAVYLAAAIVLHREQEILLAECDMATVHGLLSRIPSELPFEKLLVDARELYEQYPPDMLTSEVEDRFQRLKAMYRARGKTVDEVTKEGLASAFGGPLMTGALVVAAPLAVGYFIFKWLNSAPTPTS